MRPRTELALSAGLLLVLGMIAVAIGSRRDQGEATDSPRSTYLTGPGGASAFAEDVGTEADLFKAVQLLVERGADVKINNDAGGTVMHFAAQSGFNSVVKYLAGKGAALEIEFPPP